jgi:bacillithiol biosynthesis cysteine-adding enzyme BshC
MQKSLLPYSQIPQLAKTDVAYATQDPLLSPFYQYRPQLEVFKAVLHARRQVSTPRTDLVAALKAQYAHFPDNIFVDRQIESLTSGNTFTVCTAHQPSLLLGPLYFVYKAVTTINLADAVQGLFGPSAHVVPVFVLGSEDHDLEELNHIHLFNKQLRWAPEAHGSIGPISTQTLYPVLEELRQILGDGEHARYIFERIEKAYIRQADFGSATQALLHDLFGRYGLVVLNMNRPELKKHFIPVMRDELLTQPAHRVVQTTTEQLNALGFKTQAAPREINLFYLQQNSRERIVLENGVYKILNTPLQFSKDAMLEELELHPERFSPNVILRPLYQEIILPNLAYVGGGGELAYWLERKALFEHYRLPFPMLLRRNSVLWLDADGLKKMERLNLEPAECFLETDAVIRKFVESNAAAEVSLATETEDIKGVFESLALKAAAIDPTLEKAVRADEARQIALLEQWHARLVRVEKQKHEVSINQIRALREKYFPGNGLQERRDNFLPFYLRYGESFFDTLKENLDPFDEGFVILSERS